MDYKKWYEEYFEEANGVLRHISDVRRDLEGASAVEAGEINHRISLLYQIYYELRDSGNMIKRYAKEDKDD